MREEITFTMGLRGGAFRACHPRYSDLSVEYSRDEGEMAFGQKLSGSLKFIDTDYDWIMAQERGLEILVRLNRSGIEFFGKFVITDCEIDEDARKIEVEVEADDAYSWLKAHLDDTFNLVGLAPKNEIIEYRRRACWQYYRQGDKKLTAIMGGDYFEMDAKQTPSHSDLVNKYYFNIVDGECSLVVSRVTAQDETYQALMGKTFKGTASDYLYSSELDDWRISLRVGGQYGIAGISLERKVNSAWTVIPANSNVTANSVLLSFSVVTDSILFSYSGVEGAYFTGMYCRIVHNNANHTPKYDLPSEDIVSRTLNYNYVSVPDASIVSLMGTNEYSAKPTEWGLAPDNTNYYKKPSLPPVLGISAALYPVGKTTWGEYSWWAYFNFSAGIFDYVYWDTVQLKDAYPLSSVLSVLLDAIFRDSGYNVSFEDTEACSGFFYGTNTGIVQAPPNIYITPKTNVLTANYSQKAQKGDITIGQVLDMLRDVFRCYWFIERNADGTYRLRVENIYWFYNGGSYAGGTPYDIRNARDPRTGKNWAYGKSQFKFDISELYKRYEFGWQDECTDWFDGDAVTCLAKYVNESATNKVKIDAFTSDLDYMLLSPEEFNKDGFALLGAKPEYLFGYGYQPQKTLTVAVESSKFTLAREADADTYTRAVISTNDKVLVKCYKSDNTLLGSFGVCTNPRDFRPYFVMPRGTASVSYTVQTGRPRQSVTLSIYLASGYDRVEIPSSSDDVAPQNYRLSFHYIERTWYIADYPCRNIAFGDGDNRQTYEVEDWYPVKKSMEQELGLPWRETFDPYRGVLSTKGRALVNTYTINLLSLFQQLTLRYGTDAK